MMRRGTLLTKPGKHGTLYRYAVPYVLDRYEDGYVERATWRTWAYDAEHAIERFHMEPGDWEWTGDMPVRVRAR